ncbi:MAG TPA: hypothetical protein VLU25_21640 [Acidobacteriota bacterium]|nr:hypothetical protein [Acidobacteriota bacterium]
MRPTLAVIAALIVLNLFVILGSPYRDDFIGTLFLIVPFTLVVLLAGALVVRLLARGGRETAGQEGAGILHPKVLGLLAVLAVYEFAVSIFLAGNFLVVEFAYYLGLVVGGIMLARWCQARSYVPLLTATLVLLAVSAVSSALFVGDSHVRSLYGPERYLFALWNHAQRVNMLPLDAGVMWFSWKISLQLAASATDDTR